MVVTGSPNLVMVHWRRQGWVRYRPETRTLRSGPNANRDLFPATRSALREGARVEKLLKNDDELVVTLHVEQRV